MSAREIDRTKNRDGKHLEEANTFCGRTLLAEKQLQIVLAVRHD